MVAGDLEEMRGALTLLPEWRAAPGGAAGQQQGARGTLPEPPGEQRRAANLRGDDVDHVVWVHDEQLGEPVRGLAVGQPQHHPVVRDDRLDVDAGGPGERLRHHERPGAEHAATERGVHHHAPVTQLVTEPLENHGGVVGQHSGRGPLLLDVGGQVRARVPVELRAVEPRRVSRDLALQTPDLAAELCGPALVVAPPEREAAGAAGRGGDAHLVPRDLLDLPGGGAQREDVAHPRLVDHLLVELPDAARPLLVGGEEHAEHPAVRDGAARGRGEAQRSRAGVEPPVVAEDQPRPQLAEVGGRVGAGEQLDDGVQQAALQAGVRLGAGHGGEPLVHVEPGVSRCGRGGHGLLGEDVERVSRDPELLDLPGEHAFGGDHGRGQVPAVQRIDVPRRHRAHHVPGAPDALEGVGHRRRGTDLDHPVHRAHVDAQLQRTGGHDAPQLARLERAFDLRACLLAHGAVVRAGDHQGRDSDGIDGGHHLRRWFVRQLRQRLGRVLGCPQLVEPSRQPLGHASRVGEHQRGPSARDGVVDLLLDVRPQRRPRRPVDGERVRPASPQKGIDGGLGRAGCRARIRDVCHGEPHGHVPALVRAGCDHGDRPVSGEEPGHAFDRSDGGREGHPLHVVADERVEALQAERQVAAALRSGDRVDLVDDHRFDAGQRGSGRAGEHEVERLGSGDEDVRRPPHQRGAIPRRGVSAAHADGDVRQGQTEALRGQPDSGERGAQVAFDVDAQRLER